MQTLKKFYFGKSKHQPNTFIGGVSSTLSTPALVATKLGINENRIKAFSIIGANIEFAVIGGSYQLPANTFVSDLTITYFDDSEGLITTGHANSRFTGCTNLVYIKMKNLRNTGYQFAKGCTSLVEVLLTELIGCGWEDFEGCINLENIGNSFQKMTSIGNRTFYNCSKIPSLNLPDVGVVSSNSIGSCFFGMTALTYLNAPNLRSTVASPTTAHFTAMISNCTNLTTAIFTSLNFIGISFAKGATSLVNLDLSSVTKAAIQRSFYDTPNLSNLTMQNITTLVGGTYQCFYNSKANIVDLSKVTNTSLINSDTFENSTGLISLDLTCYTTTLGSTALNNNILRLIKTGVNITVKTALQTCNAGAPDGDLVYASGTRGATITYV